MRDQLVRRLFIILPLTLIALAVSPALESGAFAQKATYQCGDKIDNDGDGFTDNRDPDCDARYDYNELPQCSDGIDNDANGEIDFPADVDGCLSPDDDGERDLPTTPCSNGFDEDLDGLTDYPNDPDCSSEFDFTEGNGLKKGQDPFCLVPRDCGRDPGQE